GLLPDILDPATLSQSDAHVSFGDVAIGATELLLVRLDLEHKLPGATPVAAGAGDQFVISIAGSPLLLDSGFGSPIIDTQISGNVVITSGVAAVPEPNSSLLLVAVCASCLAAWRHRKYVTTPAH
ncbi:MAG: hypothetical protein KDA96_10930, partial [Planctomycetaceae bacterium]|nr:hypothetical protein [Planctomycetaceae bacterium]